MLGVDFFRSYTYINILRCINHHFCMWKYSSAWMDHRWDHCQVLGFPAESCYSTQFPRVVYL